MRPTSVASVIMTLALTFGGALIAPQAASAQSLTLGARVRASAPEFGITDRTGTLTRMTPDSVTIDFRGRSPEVTLPIQGISSLEVSTGRRVVVGLARGAGAGLLIGGVAGIALSQRGDCGHMCGLAGFYGLIVGASAGFVFGSAVGVGTAPDRWEEVQLQGQPNGFAPSAARSALALGLTISF